MGNPENLTKPYIATKEPEALEGLTGAELQQRRRAAGYSQTVMAALIGCSRHAVSHWETQTFINPRRLRYGVPAQMGEVLGFKAVCRIIPLPMRAREHEVLDRNDNRTSTHARGDGVLQLPEWTDWQQAALDRECLRVKLRVEAKAARYRQPCGAKTRKGHPCLNKSEAGRRRCKFHGGKSTGPKTPEGKARIAEAQRRRWAAHRPNDPMDRRDS